MIPASLFFGVLACVLLYMFKAARRIYRLRFHPLARFLGPADAAASRNWQRDLALRGNPAKTYQQIHDQLGTRAIRIGPNELHLSDPALYKTIYSLTTKFYKDPSFYVGFGSPTSLFPSCDPIQHRALRRMMNPMFSKGNISNYQELITNQAGLLISKLKRLSPGGLVEVHKGFKCFTGDVIGTIAFGQTLGLIEESRDSFDAALLHSLDAILEVPILTRYSWMARLFAFYIPPRVAAMLNPAIRTFFDMDEFAVRCLRESKNTDKQRSYPILFDQLQSLPDHVQCSEAGDLLVAALDTVAFTLSTALFHMARNETIQDKLFTVLEEMWPDRDDPPALKSLEQVDYLYSCVKEAIRLASAIPGSLPRVVPSGTAPLVVDDQIVPAGTVVSMSAYTMNLSREVWGDDAQDFNPDRWTNQKGKSLEPHLYAFSKGSRQCIGINLAYAELFIAMAHIVRNFRFKSTVHKWEGIDRFTFQAPRSGLPLTLTWRKN